jgi:NAD(P)-dependent dehydrogenase (short-subunit alcohol dehydrogenase family)
VHGPQHRVDAVRYDRPEAIEETAALVTRLGGTGIAAAVDHLDPAPVKALAERIRARHGHIDVLVNDIWGGELLTSRGPTDSRTSTARSRTSGGTSSEHARRGRGTAAPASSPRGAERTRAR